MIYSIIKKSQLEGALRLDAEYFQPEYLDTEKKLRSTKTLKVSDISSSVVNFGAYSLCNYIEWQDEGIPYINVGDVKDGYVEFSNIKHISSDANEILKKSKVKNGQVILTMAGSIGSVAVAHNFPVEVNSNQATAKISLKNNYSPYFLTAFFLSSHGQSQIKREIVSSVQPNIFLFQIKNFLVPDIPLWSQAEIENTFKNYLGMIEDSKKYYQQAEDLLLEELGLKNFKTDDRLFSVVNLSDLKSANRMDAEYYQKKYFNLLKIIHKFDIKKIYKIAEEVTNKCKIIPDREYNYIEISDIDVPNGECGYAKMIGRELPANAKFTLDGSELIVSKVRPTRGAIAIIPENYKNNFIASGAFSILKIASPMREYLQVVLRSVIGKLQMERPTTGTSYPTITDQDIENILIPILPLKTQQKIADLVHRSHEARKKAKELLEEAKNKVENLIDSTSSPQVE